MAMALSLHHWAFLGEAGVRSRTSFVVTCVVGLASTMAVVGVSTQASASSGHTVVRYMGARAPLATHAKTSSSQAPSPGDVVGTLEIKSTEVEARKNSPQGGSSVLNGKVRPPAADSVPVNQSSNGVTSSFEGLNHFDSRY